MRVDKTDAANKMLCELLSIVLNGNMPADWTGKGISDYLKIVIPNNNSMYNNGRPTENLTIRLLTLEPNGRAVGAFMES
jgi:hypothetical protein